MHDRLAGARVLLVEDEPLIAMHVEDILTNAGCAIIGVASNNAQALGLLGETRLDVAVLDINLGNNETSYPTADELTARRVPFVLLSGYSRSGQRPGDQSRPWVQKPVDEKELISALQVALERSA